MRHWYYTLISDALRDYQSRGLITEGQLHAILQVMQSDIEKQVAKEKHERRPLSCGCSVVYPCDNYPDCDGG